MKADNDGPQPPCSRRLACLGAVLCLLVLVRGIALMCILPPGEAWDEYQHLAYLHHLVDPGRLPILGQATVPADIQREVVRWPLPQAAVAQLGGSGRSYSDHWLGNQPPRVTSPPIRLYQAQHSPLYYLLMRPVYILSGATADLVNSLAMLRLANLLLLVAATFLFMLAICRLTPDSRLRAWSMSAVALSPLLLLTSVRVANDGLAVVFVAAAFWRCAALAMRPTRTSRIRHAGACAGLGVLVGLAFLAKATSIAMIPVALLAIWLGPGHRVIGSGVFLLACGVVIGPYLLHSHSTYGVWIPAQETLVNRQAGRTLADYWQAVTSIRWDQMGTRWWTRESLWRGGWSFLDPFKPLRRLYTLTVGAGLVILVIRIVVPHVLARLRGLQPPLRRDLLLCAGVCASYTAALSLHAVSSQLAWGQITTNAWYLAPAIPCLVYLVFSGLHAFPIPRLASTASMGFLLICLACELVGQYHTMPKAYTFRAIDDGALERLASLQTWWLGSPTLVAAVAVETLLLGVMGYVLVATKWQEPEFSPTHEVPADSGPPTRP